MGPLTTRAVYAVIRTANLGKALSAFRDRFGCNPVAVIVNAGLVEQIEAALDGKRIPVVANGGVLLGELWLERPAVDVRAAAKTLRSLTMRVTEAQRLGGPTSPARQLALMEVEAER